jgi:hypothetical protein
MQAKTRSISPGLGTLFGYIPQLIGAIDPRSGRRR